MDVGAILNAVLSMLKAIFSVLIWSLSWLFSLLYLLVSPLLYLAHSLLNLALFPVHLLVKFESFIYFVTGAVVTGVIVGLALHFTADALAHFLPLQSPRTPDGEDGYKALKNQPIDWESKWADRLPSSTILEEEENSQVSD